MTTITIEEPIRQLQNARFKNLEDLLDFLADYYQEEEEPLPKALISKMEAAKRESVSPDSSFRPVFDENV